MRPCRLPSYDSALEFLRAPSAKTAGPLVLSYLGRGALLALGFMVAQRSPKESLELGLIGATAIETFVLIHAYESISRRECQ